MIRSLNLDTLFRPTTHPEIEWEKTTFPAGEIHIRLNSSIDFKAVNKVVITHRIKNSDDLMLLLLAHDALTNLSIKSFDLIIPYVPYSRQDRVCCPGEALSIKVFSKLINSMSLENVYVIDAHSDVTPALINNCVNIPNHQFVDEFIQKNIKSNFFLVSPDSGANKKINYLYEALSESSKNKVIGIVKCDKNRDLKTRKIKNIEVLTNHDIKGSTCLIVDDICSYGNTFILLSEELRKSGVNNVSLFVTHNEGVASKMSIANSFNLFGYTNSIAQNGSLPEVYKEVKINL